MTRNCFPIVERSKGLEKRGACIQRLSPTNQGNDGFPSLAPLASHAETWPRAKINTISFTKCAYKRLAHIFLSFSISVIIYRSFFSSQTVFNVRSISSLLTIFPLVLPSFLSTKALNLHDQKFLFSQHHPLGHTRLARTLASFNFDILKDCFSLFSWRECLLCPITSYYLRFYKAPSRIKNSREVS